MAKQRSTKPVDVVVALQLTIEPEQLYAQLATAIGISVSEAHGSVLRLSAASLLQPATRSVARETFWRFLRYGVPCAFPAQIGPTSLGVPTAGSAPVFGDFLQGAEPFVWPHPDGELLGTALDPLFARAGELPAKNPELYNRLALVDSIRISHGRELDHALEILAGLLGVSR